MHEDINDLVETLAGSHMSVFDACMIVGINQKELSKIDNEYINSHVKKCKCGLWKKINDNCKNCENA